MRGGSATLQAWLNKLPSEVIDARPSLMLAQAWALVTDGVLDEAEVLLDELSRREGLAPALLGEVAAVRAIVATVHQDIPAIQAHAQEAPRLIPLEDDQLRCGVLLSQGTAAALSGSAEESVGLLTQAIRESEHGRQPIIHLIAVSTLAQMYEALGNFDQAVRLHRQVLALESDPALGRLPLIGVGYVGLGGILHEHLRFDEAEAALQQGLAIGQHWASPEIQIGGYWLIPKLCATNQGRNKPRCNPFQVDAVFTHCHIVREISFMHTTKGSQEIAYSSPHTFRRVDVDLPAAIAIIITRPFVVAMIDRDALAFDVIVALPFIGIHDSLRSRELRQMFLQRLAVGMLGHTQPHLVTLASDGANDRRAIILIGSVPSLFVSAPAWRIGRIAVFFAFFPPHAAREPSHQFQSLHRVMPYSVVSVGRSRGAADEDGGRYHTPPVMRAISSRSIRLYRRPATVESLGPDAAACAQTRCPYRPCIPPDSLDTDTGEHDSGWFARSPGRASRCGHTGTVQLVWMKVLSQPALAQLIITYLKNWKVHVWSVSSWLYGVNSAAFSLGMSLGHHPRAGCDVLSVGDRAARVTHTRRVGLR